MKQKKTGISAEKQEQWILQGKYVILAVLVGICVGIVDTIFGRGLLEISSGCIGGSAAGAGGGGRGGAKWDRKNGKKYRWHSFRW